MYDGAGEEVTKEITMSYPSDETVAKEFDEKISHSHYKSGSEHLLVERRDGQPLQWPESEYEVDGDKVKSYILTLRATDRAAIVEMVEKTPAIAIQTAEMLVEDDDIISRSELLTELKGL